MSEINVTKVVVNNPICDIFDPFVFTIEFEALNKLEADIEWKIFYISAVNDEGEGNKDIELDNILLGPIERGVMMFDYAVNPPDYKNMDIDSVLGLQAILISANYKGKEFIRIAYYMNCFYKDVQLREKPPLVPEYDKMCRHIFVENPRIVKFIINWDNEDKDEFKEFDNENEKIKTLDNAVVDMQGNFQDSSSNIPTAEKSEMLNEPMGSNATTNGNFENNNFCSNNFDNSNGTTINVEKRDIYNENLRSISKIKIDNN